MNYGPSFTYAEVEAAHCSAKRLGLHPEQKGETVVVVKFTAEGL